MDGPIFGACALIAGLAAAVSARQAYSRRRQPRYRVARWARTVAVGVCSFGSALSVPSVANAVSELTGINSIAKLTAHLAAVAFMGCLQIMIVDWTHTRAHMAAAVCSRSALILVIQIALTWQFVAANHLGLSFTTDHADNIQVVAYLLTYLSFGAVAGLEIAILGAGMALGAWSRRRSIAIGLASTALGGAAVLAYTVSKGGYLIAYQVGFPWSLSVEKAISSPFAGLGTLLMVVGLCLPMAGHRATAESAATS